MLEWVETMLTLSGSDSEYCSSVATASLVLVCHAHIPGELLRIHCYVIPLDLQ